MYVYFRTIAIDVDEYCHDFNITPLYDELVFSNTFEDIEAQLETQFEPVFLPETATEAFLRAGVKDEAQTRIADHASGLLVLPALPPVEMATDVLLAEAELRFPVASNADNSGLAIAALAVESLEFGANAVLGFDLSGIDADADAIAAEADALRTIAIVHARASRGSDAIRPATATVTLQFVGGENNEKLPLCGTLSIVDAALLLDVTKSTSDDCVVTIGDSAAAATEEQPNPAPIEPPSGEENNESMDLPSPAAEMSSEDETVDTVDNTTPQQMSPNGNNSNRNLISSFIIIFVLVLVLSNWLWFWFWEIKVNFY